MTDMGIRICVLSQQTKKKGLPHCHVPCVQALDLAAAATEASQFKSWWWKMQVGKCYYRWAHWVLPSCMHQVGAFPPAC